MSSSHVRVDSHQAQASSHAAIDSHGSMDLYLDLLKRTLTGMVWEDPPIPVWWMPANMPYNASMREKGQDWPASAPTMIGTNRLQNIRDRIEDVLRDGIPGDLLEAGIWRGGACIFMRAVLKAHGVTDRLVWAADSFQGLPRHAPGHEPLAVPEDEVRRNFERYGLLDDQVRFIPGWFNDSLPTAPVEKLAVLIADGDQYSSQTAVLVDLYPRLSPGGYMIIDDYPGIGECKQAIDDYRREHGITSPMTQAGAAAYWRKD